MRLSYALGGLSWTFPPRAEPLQLPRHVTRHEIRDASSRQESRQSANSAHVQTLRQSAAVASVEGTSASQGSGIHASISRRGPAVHRRAEHGNRALNEFTTFASHPNRP